MKSYTIILLLFLLISVIMGIVDTYKIYKYSDKKIILSKYLKNTYISYLTAILIIVGIVFQLILINK